MVTKFPLTRVHKAEKVHNSDGFDLSQNSIFLFHDIAAHMTRLILTTTWRLVLHVNDCDEHDEMLRR